MLTSLTNFDALVTHENCSGFMNTAYTYADGKLPAIANIPKTYSGELTLFFDNASHILHKYTGQIRINTHEKTLVINASFDDCMQSE